MARGRNRIPQVASYWIVQLDEFGMVLIDECPNEADVTVRLEDLMAGPQRYVLRILNDRRKQLNDPVGYRGISAENWLAGKRMVGGSC